jgi:hypothetical protein
MKMSTIRKAIIAAFTALPLLLAAPSAMAQVCDMSWFTWNYTLTPQQWQSCWASVAPVSNPTFSGSVVFPDGSSVGSSGWTIPSTLNVTGTFLYKGVQVPSTGAVNAWSAGQSSVPVVLACCNVTPDFSKGNVFTMTLTGNVTLNNPINMPAGQEIVLFLTQGGSGGYTISSWGTYYKFPGGTKPTLSTAVGAKDSITAISDTTTTLNSSFLGNFK